MADSTTVLETCKHCGEVKNLQILFTATKRIYDEDISQYHLEELKDLGETAYMLYKWELLFCPNCKEVTLKEHSAWSEDTEYIWGHRGIVGREEHWKERFLYPQQYQNYTELINQIQNENVRDDLLEVFPYKLQTIDTTLFRLGRAFENTVQQYFKYLVENGKIKAKNNIVTKDDLQQYRRLSNKIDLLVKNKYLEEKDKSNLDRLRTERNNPAHEVPHIAQKKKILDDANVLFTLYLEYILMIERKICDFQTDQ